MQSPAASSGEAGSTEVQRVGWKPGPTEKAACTGRGAVRPRSPAGQEGTGTGRAQGGMPQGIKLRARQALQSWLGKGGEDPNSSE